MNAKTLVLIASLGLSCVLGSCKDFLNTEPSGSEPTSSVLQDYNLLQPVRNGVYDGLQGSNSANSYYASRFLLAADVMGDLVQSTVSGSRGNSYYQINYDANSELGCWYLAYNTIRKANRLIAMCSSLEEQVKASSLSPENKKERLDFIALAQGEGLAVRALAHFDLLRQYATPYPFSQGGSALGVPLELSAHDGKSTPARATVGEVYKQIIADFRKALELGGLPRKAYGRFSSSAVKGLLARVYLYMNTPEGNREALALSKELIESADYSLAKTEEDYMHIWSEPKSQEMIFCLSNFDTKDWGDREGLPYVYSVDGYHNAHLTKKFYDELMTDPKDIRWSVLKGAAKSLAITDANALDGVTGDTKIWINKYPGKAAYKDVRTNDIPIIRLGEVYLNAAEAAFKLGDRTSALTYLNAIVQRANPAKQVTDAELTLERILQERGKELFGEGHRFFDLMRTGQRCERFTDGAPGWHGTLKKEASSFDHTYFRSILPIPQSELDANPVIRAQQNPGY